MSHIQNELNQLTDTYRKALLRFDEQRYAYLRASIQDLVRKKIVLERDARQIVTVEWQRSALHNWMKEPQFSSRCPGCQIDIVGPRKLMHYHLKWHDSKRTEIRENDNYIHPFRIHFPTFKEFS